MVFIVFYLTVNNTVEPETQRVKLRQDATFKCNFKGTVQWYFQDGMLPYNVRIEKEKTIHIRGVEEVNGGYYQCTGKTEFNVTYHARGLLIIMGKCHCRNATTAVIMYSYIFQ